MADPTQPQTITDILRAQNAAGAFAGPRPAADLGGYDPFKNAVKMGSGNGVFGAPVAAPVQVATNTVVPATAPTVANLMPTIQGAADTARTDMQAVSLPNNGNQFNPANFASTYGEAAQRAGTALGVEPTSILGHWGEETGWGKSVIPGTNNLGNVKDFTGGGVSATDNMTGEAGNYRAFANPNDFADHYVSLISRKYPGAVGTGADVGKFAGALSAGGYAEDPNYASKVQAATGKYSLLGTNPGSGGGNGGAASGGLPTVSYANGDNTPLRTQAGALRGAGLINPGGAIQAGYEQQLQYQQAALNNIMNAAGQGDSRNYSFRLAHLVGAMGNNNFGQVQGQGADALNQAIAGVGNTGLNTGANTYGADSTSRTALAQIESAQQLEANKAQPIGTTVDTSAGYPVSQTNYGMVRNGKVTPLAADATAGRQAAAKPKEGATGKTPDGRAVMYKNGQWQEAGK
jgi:hypothetical protein